MHEPLTIGKHPEVFITGIGHVGGLRDVLQPASNSTPALLSFTNYLEAWPNSIVLINFERAINIRNSIGQRLQFNCSTFGGHSEISNSCRVYTEVQYAHCPEL